MAVNTEHWQTQNPQWLKERQTSWQKRILPMLKEFVSKNELLEKDELKQYKHYYLKGERLPYTQNQWMVGWRAKYLATPVQIPLVLQILLHPAGDLAFFQKLVADYLVEIDELIAEFKDPEQRFTEMTLYQDYNSRIDCVLRFLNEHELSKTQYCDRLLMCKNFEEYVAPHLKGRHLERRLADKIGSLNNLFSSTNGYTAGQRKPFAPYRFCFELYRYILTTINYNDLYDDNVRSVKVYMNRLNHMELQDQPGKDYVAAANVEAKAMFDAGITPEIDALWAQSKNELLDWKVR